MNPLNTPGRIWFLQLCRGIACLLIVYVHWVSFLQNPNEMCDIIMLPPLKNYPDLSLIGVIDSHLLYYLPTNFRMGYFCVSLFFLVSGFVIPFSMEKISPFEYLFRRIMRIYPAVLVCVSIASLLLMGAKFIATSETRFLIKEFIGSIFLVADFFSVRLIEPGLWTLEVEVRFYFICFILAFFSGHRKALVLIALSPIILAVFGSLYSMYISFMLIGTCLYNWSNKNWSGKKTCLLIFILLLMNRFYINQHTFAAEISALIYENNLYGLLIFALMIFLNDKLPYSAVMDNIANVSFPLYLFHGAAAYAIYYSSYSLTHSVVCSAICSLLWMIFASMFIHHYVENPSIQLSKRIINWAKGWKAAVASPLTKGEEPA